MEVRQDRHCKINNNKIKSGMLRMHLRGSPRMQKDKEIKMRLIEIKNQFKNSNMKIIDFFGRVEQNKNQQTNEKRNRKHLFLDL